MDKIINESSQEDVFDNCNAVAKEMGYTITKEDMQTFADEHKEELTDEELDKVAGGTTSIAGNFTATSTLYGSGRKLDSK